MDYTKLTDDELRRAIAEAKGWKHNPTTLAEAKELGWTRIDPREAGGNCITLYAGEPGEVHLRPPWEWNYIRDFPDWPGSIAAAWELVEIQRDWKIESTGDGYIVTIYDRATHYQAIDISAERAICLAWLQWKRGEK
jgi:hypothetical protein